MVASTEGRYEWTYYVIFLVSPRSLGDERISLIHRVMYIIVCVYTYACIYAYIYTYLYMTICFTYITLTMISLEFKSFTKCVAFGFHFGKSRTLGPLTQLPAPGGKRWWVRSCGLTPLNMLFYSYCALSWWRSRDWVPFSMSLVSWPTYFKRTQEWEILSLSPNVPCPSGYV